MGVMGKTFKTALFYILPAPHKPVTKTVSLTDGDHQTTNGFLGLASLFKPANKIKCN